MGQVLQAIGGLIFMSFSAGFTIGFADGQVLGIIYGPFIWQLALQIAHSDYIIIYSILGIQIVSRLLWIQFYYFGGYFFQRSRSFMELLIQSFYYYNCYDIFSANSWSKKECDQRNVCCIQQKWQQRHLENYNKKLKENKMNIFGLCKICLEKKATFINKNCGHLCLCQQHSHSVKKCPLCNKQGSFMKVYTSL